ncbi:MAG: beta-methylgalactoside transporter [Clostridia bacterium]
MAEKKKETGNNSWFRMRIDGIKQRNADYKALDRKGKAKWWSEFLLRNAIYIIFALLIIYVQIYSMTNPSMKHAFLSFPTLIDILKKSSLAMFLALGVGGIIVLTGTDLSAGYIMGLSMCVSASLLQKSDLSTKMWLGMEPWPILAVIVLVMVICGIVGAFNGFFVAKFKLHPFIVTLATQLMLSGFLLIYMAWGNGDGAQLSGMTTLYKDITKGTVQMFGTSVPYYVFYAMVAVLIMTFIWNKTTIGKNMYAVGANPEAANVSGVNVGMTIIIVFMMAGMLYGFSGFIQAPFVGSVTPNSGDGAELDAIAACVIGGVSFTGGTGRISGIVIGVILLQIITVALQWLGISPNLQYIIKGLIILVAVAIDMRKYLVRK